MAMKATPVVCEAEDSDQLSQKAAADVVVVVVLGQDCASASATLCDGSSL